MNSEIYSEISSEINTLSRPAYANTINSIVPSFIPYQTGFAPSRNGYSQAIKLKELKQSRYLVENQTRAIQKPQIKGEYVDDYPITEINKKIIEFLSEHKSERLAEQQRIIDQQNALRHSGRLNLITWKQTQELIEQAQQKIDRINRDDDLMNYQTRAAPLLENYQCLSQGESSGQDNKRERSNCNGAKIMTKEDYFKMINGDQEDLLGANKNTKQELTLLDWERIKIIEEYLELAKEYVSIDISRVRNISTKKCPGCQLPLESNLIEESNGVKHCQCGVEVKNYCCMKSLNYALDEKDKGDRALTRNCGKGTSSENRLSYERAIEYYQGLQRVKFNEELFELLDNYFTAYGLVTREKAKRLPLIVCPDISPEHPYYQMCMKIKPGTGIDMMITALSKTGNPAYYDHVHLLCALHWGWQLADISKLKDQLLADYDITQPVYIQWFNEKYQVNNGLSTNSGSSTNTPGLLKKYSNQNNWYRLMRQLQAREFPCNRSHFKMVSDVTLEKYEEAWRLMVAALQIKYVPV